MNPVSAPWTEAHRREALLYLLDLARADVLGVESFEDIDPTGYQVLPDDVETEEAFVVALAEYESEPQAAVRRVRALAEGRLVREHGYRVSNIWCMHTDTGACAANCAQDRAAAAEHAERFGLPIFRVTRIRRAR